MGATGNPCEAEKAAENLGRKKSLGKTRKKSGRQDSNLRPEPILMRLRRVLRHT